MYGLSVMFCSYVYIVNNKACGAGYSVLIGVVYDVKFIILVTAFYYLRNINRVRKSLTAMAVETSIQAFVTSKLDYSSRLFYGACHSCSIACKKRKTTLHASSPITMRGNGNIYPQLSGWAALVAFKTAHWLQNATVRLQSSKLHGPCLSGWPPSNIHARKKTWSPRVNITLIHHVHSLKPTVIKRSCLWHHNCGMNYQKTSGVSNLVRFSRPSSNLTYICRPFFDELICPSLWSPSVNLLLCSHLLKFAFWQVCSFDGLPVCPDGRSGITHERVAISSPNLNTDASYPEFVFIFLLVWLSAHFVHRLEQS